MTSLPRQTLLSLWPEPPDSTHTPARVPQRYFGVWSRTLLQTPEQHDTTTFVRWMQLGLWHVDLRIPVAAHGAKQGFCGITQVTQRAGGEVCTWRRLVDYQPPRATVDEGFMVFKTPEQVVETGIHGVYHEVWDRLPGSTGRQIALAQKAQHTDPHTNRHSGQRAADATSASGVRLFVSDDFVMRVQPCQPIGPAFEISFGRLENGVWHVEQSTLAALAGQRIALRFAQSAPDQATVQTDGAQGAWDILEWFNP